LGSAASSSHIRIPAQILVAFGALPGQVRQRGGEVDRVLAGAAADLQHARPVGEAFAQHREDRLAVAIAGGSVGLLHGAALAGKLVRRHPCFIMTAASPRESHMAKLNVNGKSTKSTRSRIRRSCG
jgi:hypothetical protein